MAPDLMSYFRAEARELWEKLSQDTLSFEREPNGELMGKLLRHAHTLKGAARVVEQKEIADAVHRFEGLLGDHRDDPESFPRPKVDELLALLDQIAAVLADLERGPSPAPAETGTPPTRARSFDEGGLGVLTYQSLEVDSMLEDLRAATGQLEALRRNLQGVERGKTLGELLLAQLGGDAGSKTARLVAEELQSQLRGVERSLAFGVDQIERELRQVQESTEKLRLVRAEALFPVLRRVLRDATSERGLQAELVTSGGALRLDAQLMGAVQGALVQAVRNCAAHGIEPAEERARLGKPACATVSVEVSRQGGRVIFRCRDDGRGVDLPGLRRRLEGKGMRPEQIEREGLLNILLRGGVSTAETVTQAAGRGIGMDLIREAASSLGGEASLRTEGGRFTELTLRLPWTVAGLELLEVSAGEHLMLVPLDCVRAAVRLKPDEIASDAAGETVLHEGKGVRLLRLNALMGPAEPLSLNCRVALLLQSSEGLMALGASSLRGTRVASLFPLPRFSEAAAFIAGAVLNADGDPQLVLDPEALFAESLRTRSVSTVAAARSERLLVIDDSLTTRMLQQSVLEAAGFEVELASSAEEGLEKIRRESYGLVLVDVEMPGMDGFAFVETVRADASLRQVPILMVTSRDAPEDKLRGRSVGAQGYIVKSEYDQKDLLRQIRSFLE